VTTSLTKNRVTYKSVYEKQQVLIVRMEINEAQYFRLTMGAAVGNKTI